MLNVPDDQPMMVLRVQPNPILDRVAFFSMWWQRAGPSSVSEWPRCQWGLGHGHAFREVRFNPLAVIMLNGSYITA